MLFITLLAAWAIFVSGCDPDDYGEFEGYCYRFVQLNGLYSNAVEKCKSYGGYLTDISSKKQLNFLVSVLSPQPGGQMPEFFPLTGMIYQGDGLRFVHPVVNGTEEFKYDGKCYIISPNGKCVNLQVHDDNTNCFSIIDCDLAWGAICKLKAPPTTPKPKPTTTPAPKIANPKKWICNERKGIQIHRSRNDKGNTHHYTIDWRTTPAAFSREGGPGFVVSVARFPQIKATCPNLVKVGVWRSGTITYIGNSPPATFVKKESFYCAPRQFYCGANFLLRRLDKQGGGDIFYASTENEANKQLLGYPPAIYSRNWFVETPCWIWQNYEDTWYSQVRAAGGMIWGGYEKTGIVHFYSLQRHLLPAGFQQSPGPGYVILQGLYDSHFKKECPELIPARIWHGQNGNGQTITWIGREGRNPPAKLQKNVQREELRFYCAPRFNYCNANFLLRRMDKTDGSTFFYPQTENEAYEQLRGDPPGVFKNTKWTEEVCYIWARW